MFEEVREMIDSTIYSNGRGEVTAQNVNLAMHGMVDATEEGLDEMEKSVEATNNKIVELGKQIEEGGLGGLEFSFPMMLITFLEINPNGFIFDRATTAAIIEDMPSLAEPIDKLFEKNAKAYEKYVAAVEEGEAPIVNIKFTDLFKELAGAEGIEGIDEQMYGVASTSGVMSGGGVSYCMFMFNAAGIQMAMVFLQDGTCSIVEYSEPATVYIPVPGEEYENTAIYDLSPNNQYQYVIPDGDLHKYEDIFPVHIKQSELGQNYLIRFVVNTDLIEGIINLESGRTTSRVIAKMTPEEVGVIAEGTLSCNYSSVPSSGAAVTFTVRANVLWKVVEGEKVIAEGEGGDMSTNSTKINYTIEANTSAEVLNHNYRLVATADGEELATLWIEQAAAPETETTEQVTEE